MDRNGQVLYHSEKAEDKHKFEVFLNEEDNQGLFLAADSNVKEVIDVSTTTESGVNVNSGEEYVETRTEEQDYVKLEDT